MSSTKFLLRIHNVPTFQYSWGFLLKSKQGNASESSGSYPIHDHGTCLWLTFVFLCSSASGSGKSTLTTLLQHLYEPDSGAVLLDGRRLPRTDVRFLRDHIAIVSQHRALFDMTVAEKIAYGCDIIDEDAVIRAAKAANVHELISSLPKGYQTMLGENASLISGGQAQRLQIARALLHPREILILDECTSALDAANQAAVMETISEVKKGKTTIFVTHKLAVMETCDRLLVMMDGAVMEQCSVAELKAAGGVFAQLASGGEWETS